MQTAQEAADLKYPPNQPVGDPESSDPEDYEGQSDPYGYDETANKAFVEGAAWQAAQFESMVKRISAILLETGADGRHAILEAVEEWELAQ